MNIYFHYQNKNMNESKNNSECQSPQHLQNYIVIFLKFSRCEFIVSKLLDTK